MRKKKLMFFNISWAKEDQVNVSEEIKSLMDAKIFF